MQLQSGPDFKRSITQQATEVNLPREEGAGTIVPLKVIASAPENDALLVTISNTVWDGRTKHLPKQLGIGQKPRIQFCNPLF
jgi:hypothetical protein